jgi:hypothetical protein
MNEEGVWQEIIQNKYQKKIKRYLKFDSPFWKDKILAEVILWLAMSRIPDFGRIYE